MYSLYISTWVVLMSRYFKLTDVEYDRACKFERVHSSHGETLSYIFTIGKNNRGQITRVKCNSCGKSENITEFS